MLISRMIMKWLAKMPCRGTYFFSRSSNKVSGLNPGCKTALFLWIKLKSELCLYTKYCPVLADTGQLCKSCSVRSLFTYSSEVCIGTSPAFYGKIKSALELNKNILKEPTKVSPRKKKLNKLRTNSKKNSATVTFTVFWKSTGTYIIKWQRCKMSYNC